MNKTNWLNIYIGLAVLESVILLTVSFGYWNKIDKQKAIIDKQEEQIKMFEEKNNVDRDYLYQCYKQIEENAERSGK